MENFREQLFPEDNHTRAPDVPDSIESEEYKTKRSTANIKAQRNLMLSMEYLPLETTNKILCNPFVKKVATSMLQFRCIGQEEFDRQVAYYILKEASIHPPLRKKAVNLIPKKANKEASVTTRKRQESGAKVLAQKIEMVKTDGQTY